MGDEITTDAESADLARQSSSFRMPGLEWLLRSMLKKARIGSNFADSVRSAGPRCIHVTLHPAATDFLLLRHFLKKNALPEIALVGGANSSGINPVWRRLAKLRPTALSETNALAELVRKHDSIEPQSKQGNLQQQSLQQGSALLPLRSREDTALLETLLEAQKTLATNDTPIVLVPHAISWGEQGDYSPKRRFWRFFLSRRRAQLRTGEAISLRAFIEQNPGESIQALARRLSVALLRRLRREHELIAGPEKKTRERVLREVLRSPRLKSELAAIEGNSEKHQKRARKILRHVAANQKTWMLRIKRRFMAWMFRRIYDGLDIDETGMERIREATRKGPVVLLPSHKSHMDYLVMSYVLYVRGLAPPLIAAGDNLSFFPLGWVLRRGGAFFIKRRFGRDQVYPAVLAAYLRRLLIDGSSIEFFIEGGRSRTGRLRDPKLGLLKQIAEAAEKMPTMEVTLVPISIGYDRVIERQSLSRELDGGRKQTENLGTLLRSTRVLRSRYGRLYIRIGQLISVRDWLAESPSDNSAQLDDASAELRQRLPSLAQSVVQKIDASTVVSPMALAAMTVLNVHPRGASGAFLFEEASHLLRALFAARAPIAPALLEVFDDARDPAGAWLRRDSFDEALALLVDNKLLTETNGHYFAPSESRLALAYYKNTALHFLEHAANRAVTTLAREAGRPELLFELLQKEARGTGDSQGTASLNTATTCDRPVARVLRSHLESIQLILFFVRMDTPKRQTKGSESWRNAVKKHGRRLIVAGELRCREAISDHRLDRATRVLELGKIVERAPDRTSKSSDKNPKHAVRLVDEVAAVELLEAIGLALRAMDE